MGVMARREDRKQKNRKLGIMPLQIKMDIAGHCSVDRAGEDELKRSSRNFALPLLAAKRVP
jgi:hypothetical protein